MPLKDGARRFKMNKIVIIFLSAMFLFGTAFAGESEPVVVEMRIDDSDSLKMPEIKTALEKVLLKNGVAVADKAGKNHLMLLVGGKAYMRRPGYATFLEWNVEVIFQKGDKRIGYWSCAGEKQGPAEISSQWGVDTLQKVFKNAMEKDPKFMDLVRANI